MLTKRQRRVIRMNNVGTQNSDAIQMNNIVSDNTVREGVSVCISAWETAEYIEECLDSVAAQTWFKNHDNWEILLGIDGCEETLDKVKQIMHKYKNLKVMMMDKNVGTYVTCNTIMKEARYEWLLRFDSDDVMYPNMVETLMKRSSGYELVLCRCKSKDSSPALAEGSIFVSKNRFIEYGGFLNRRCGSDTEFRIRTKMKIHQLKIDDVLFFRGIRDNSLTKIEEYGYKSQYRDEVRRYIKEKSPFVSKIEFVTSPFSLIRINGEKIIVSFTSWKKRIHNCSHIVDLFFKQTLKPDKIILNLSSDEFVNKENDLPQELVEKQNNIFEIYWVKGNTKVYKKIMPTLDRFPNDVIVSIDDDIEYPTNFIETIYSYYLDNERKHPVTSGTCKWENDIFTHYGCFSLIRRDMIEPYYDEFYNNIVLKHGIDNIPFDDLLFTYSVLMNGNRYVYTDSMNMSKIRQKSIEDKKNAVSTIGTKEYNRTIDNEHNIIRKYIFEKYKKTYDDLTKDKIVVSLTTWAKRDKCVPIMLEHLKKQTRKPDRIILWLSEEEYDRNKIPNHLQECLDKKLLTDIMWVKKNTYCHKRFECFKYFNDCYNIFVDDDILYPNDFIDKLYTAAKNNPKCIINYSTYSVYYDGYKAIIKDAIKGASHYNSFMGGCCCFPPYILPDDVFEKTELRDEYVTKCDESWIRPLLIKHGIKIYSLYTFNKKQYKTIEGSQENSVWSENKTMLKNGMREKERNFFNSVKIHNAVNECKKLWPKMNIEQWTLLKK